MSPPDDADNGAKRPLEIPWRLAGTTRTLAAEGSDPEGSSVSLFTYCPDDTGITGDPDVRLVYMRVSVSLRSEIFDTPDAPEPIRVLLEGGHPVWAAALDARVSPDNDRLGRWMPHFASAAPLRRSVIETGVIGDEAVEGESLGVSMGKSGSQMHESFETSTHTSSSGGSLPILDLWAKSTSTSVAGTRDVVEVTDTTTREAAEERRLLLSHTTKVENVLSVLTATGVGTPYLRWTLSPRPLRQLAIDPTDPTSWYSELLRRRSSGLTGVQDFFAVVALPRAFNGFCVQLKLQTVAFVEPAPQPPSPNLGQPSIVDRALTMAYLSNKYPVGTPVDDVDVMLTDMPTPLTGWHDQKSLVIDGWYLAPNFFVDDFHELYVMAVVRGITIEPRPPTTNEVYGEGPYNLGQVGQVAAYADQYEAKLREWQTSTDLWSTATTVVPYKVFSEVHQERRLHDYRTALATSPLVGGTPVATSYELSACFDVTEDGDIKPKAAPRIELKNPAQFGLGPVTTLTHDFGLVADGRAAITAAARTATTTWNDVERQVLSELLAHSDWSGGAAGFDGARLHGVGLRHLAALAPDDARNQPLATAASWLGLKKSQLTRLERAGVTDLRDLATARLHHEALEAMSSDSHHPAGGTISPKGSKNDTKRLPVLKPSDVRSIDEQLTAELNRALDGASRER